jgi:hypothetical protein
MRILMLITYPNIRGPIPKYTPHLVAVLRQHPQAAQAMGERGRQHILNDFSVERMYFEDARVLSGSSSTQEKLMCVFYL